jgi:predicted SAM-dependent methyltransferase
VTPLLRLARRLLPAPLRVAAAETWREARIAWLTRGARRHLATVPGPVDVNLGSGPDMRAGWLNVDLHLGGRRGVSEVSPATFFLNHDLRTGLPMDAGTSSTIYSSHFFEHLARPQAESLLADCFRSLVPGGRLHLVVPDIAAVATAYACGPRDHLDLLDRHLDSVGHVRTTGDSAIDAFEYAVYQLGEHLQSFDGPKLVALVAGAGFADVRVRQYDPGIDIDDPLRRAYSLYVEAVRP